MRCISITILFLFFINTTFGSACLKDSSGKQESCNEVFLEGNVSEIMKIQQKGKCNEMIPGNKRVKTCPLTELSSKCVYKTTYCEDFSDKNSCKSFKSIKYFYNNANTLYSEKTLKSNCDLLKGKYQKL